MSRFFNRSLDRLVPYTPGEQPQDQQYVKLNTNESPYPPSPGVIAALNAREAADLRLYSDPEAKVLKAVLAERYSVEPANIFVGNGSDEALNFAFLAYAAEGRGAAFADITYGFYPVFAELYHIPVRIVPLKEDFTLDPEDYYGLHRTIVIANPNAPTGLALSRAQVEGILQANPDCVVVLDEAYVDFGGESAACLLGRYDNLLVVGTFSKSRSLAGARLGYAVGSPALIADLNTVKFSFNPYNINRLTLLAGEAALADAPYFARCCTQVAAVRDETAQALRALGFTVTDSKTNFLFAGAHPAVSGGEYYAALRQSSILVRHFTLPRIENWVRITVGTAAQMQRLVDVTKQILDARHSAAR